MRSELEGREGRKCWEYKWFGYLAKNCRNKGGRVEEKKKSTNRFETLTSRIIQCGVREVRRQEVMRKEVKCFGCGEDGHKKWECITNGYLLVCDLQEWSSKGSKMRSSLATKDVVKSEV